MEMRFCRQANLSDKVALFNKQADQHKEKQAVNPFSSEGSALHKPTLDKSDPNYGRPVAGSKTDIRGKKAHNHISKEVLQLCQIIYENGEPIEELTADGRNHIVISFGELFQIYTSISNKVVGRRDDDVPVILRKSLPEIGEIFQAQMEKVEKY
ncbi:hypothetical protein C0J52_09094 [Blattella germanica]|nr:hypothetical protein C0J52_09094 [Blattella germanica]